MLMGEIMDLELKKGYTIVYEDDAEEVNDLFIEAHKFNF